jgi:hypothetical protein
MRNRRQIDGWKLEDLVHNLRRKGQLIGLRGACASIRCSRRLIQPCSWRDRRTAWHTHPLGQMLVVTSGLELAQREGGPIEEIRAGDVIWYAPNERHWHGAAPTTAMTHTAIQEALNGKVADWMEKVSDEQYKK